LVVPNSCKNEFEEKLKTSKLPLNYMERSVLGEDHTMYKLMTCFFAPRYTINEEDSNSVEVDGVTNVSESKQMARISFELNITKTDIKGYEEFIKTSYDEYKKANNQVNFVEWSRLPKIKEV